MADSQLLSKILQIAQEEASNPYRFAPLAETPNQFVSDVLGQTLWSKQIEILEAPLKYPRVAVRSGHSLGKTFTMACLALFWLYCKQGLVITTAPSKEHVEDVLWREINSLANKAKVPLPGQSFLAERKIDDTWYAVGITARDSSHFQGRHHPRLLVIVDEPTGVAEDIHLAISTLTTDEYENRIVMIGNPTTTSGTFFEAFKSPSWHKIHASCLDHPNVVTGERVIPGAVTRGWVEERRRVWGESHPLWASRVLGEFPRISSRGVIPLAWVERAQNEEQRLQALQDARDARVPRVAGLDVARYGDNSCVLIVRRGDAVEAIIDWHHTSIPETARRAKKLVDEWELKSIVVDASGLGAGVADLLFEERCPVIAYNGGHRAFTPSTFNNRRSELWWHLRQRLEHQRLWLPRGCERLEADLIAPEYQMLPSGRLQVETKEKLLDRGVPSPDWGDALVESFAMDEDPEAFLQEKPDPKVQDPNPILWAPDGEQSDFDSLPWGF